MDAGTQSSRFAGEGATEAGAEAGPAEGGRDGGGGSALPCVAWLAEDDVDAEDAMGGGGGGVFAAEVENARRCFARRWRVTLGARYGSSGRTL